MRLESFGLHKDKMGVWWLVQSKRMDNAVGLREKPEFEMERRRCSHAIDLDQPAPSEADWFRFENLCQIFPICRIMAPGLRRQMGIFRAIGDLASLHELTRLCSPTIMAVQMMLGVNKKEIYDDLIESNIQALPVTGVEARDTSFIRTMSEYAGQLPRPFVFHSNDPNFRSPYKVLDLTLPEHDVLRPMPLEALGAEVLRRFMRGEEE